ncbi:phage tail tape measure protein [Paenibacillus azoreducens]|uniref:Phage tail tape measure protein domain-containing protein n=1 Tax=Paenibacillus azoreducens TaxID=116718 RepID=A0A919YC34_9BACL|nr:phage tail tape measure protein [Paenibacillus azoreducens]GIO47971.1 hypothetical protein J34TS1_27360 [Paenibacillus azoreducens]
MAEKEFYRLDLVIGTEGVEHTEKQVKAIDKLIEQTTRRAAALNKTRINPTARVDDRVTTPAQKIESRLDKLNRTVAKPEVKLSDRISNDLGKLKSKLSSIVKKVWKIPVTAAIAGSLALGGAAAYLGVNSVHKAMDFESELSTIQALTGATNAEMAKMQTLALKMGADTKYNALEAAQGIEELLKAGLTPAAVQAGGLEAALNLATAGGLGLADAAEIMSTALNAYKKDGMAASQAADILAGTANASATGVEELRYSLAMASAVASGVGMSFKDTNVALGLFANNGLKGSDAGTSLKTMLSNLVPKTSDAYSLFEQFNLLVTDTTASLSLLSKAGIKPASGSVTDINKALEKYVARQQGLKEGTNKATKATREFMMANNLIHSAFYDEKGNLRDLEQIAGVLQDRFGKLTNEQRQFYMNQIFGSDAIRAGTILFKEGAKGVKEFEKEMSNVTALEVAKKKMDNAAGAVEQFNGAVETLQISALLPTMPIIKRVALGAADFVEKYTPEITAAVDKMMSKAQHQMDVLAKNPEFQKADLFGKMKIAWDTVITQPLTEWWDGNGKQAVDNLADKMGTVLGVGLKGVFMGALGIFDKDDDKKSVYMSAGESAGKSFFDAFIKAFDAGAIVNKLLEAFQNMQPEWLGGNTTSTAGTIASLGFDAWLMYKLVNLVKGPTTLGKNVLDKGKNVFGKFTGKSSPPKGSTVATDVVTNTGTRTTTQAPTNTRVGSQAKYDPRYRTPTKAMNPPKEWVQPGIATLAQFLGIGSKITIGATGIAGIAGVGYNILSGGSAWENAAKDKNSIYSSVMAGRGGNGVTPEVQNQIKNDIMNQVIGSPTAKNQNKDVVKISPEQIDSIVSNLQDFKQEVKNEINVSVTPGAVQVNMPTQTIDYDEVANKVGWTVANQVRRGFQNKVAID